MKSLLHIGKTVTGTIGTYALSVLASTGQAFAQFGEIPDVTGTGTTDLQAALIRVVQYILGFLGIIAVIVIVVAGIRLIIGGADEGQREKARNAILYAVIGLVIVLLASAIVNFTVNALT